MKFCQKNLFQLDSSFVEKVMNDVKKVGEKCAEENKATSEDLAEIHAHKMPPTSHEAKCVLACFYKHYNIMSSSGTFEKSAVIAAFEPMKKMSEEIYGKVMKVVDACDNSGRIAKLFKGFFFLLILMF